MWKYSVAGMFFTSLFVYWFLVFPELRWGFFIGVLFGACLSVSAIYLLQAWTQKRLSKEVVCGGCAGGWCDGCVPDSDI